MLVYNQKNPNTWCGCFIPSNNTPMFLKSFIYTLFPHFTPLSSQRVPSFLLPGRKKLKKNKYLVNCLTHAR